jgi:hypothetical protein
MPFYLKDRATQFAEIYSGNERVGMALMFAGKNSGNEPVLMVNSIETSEKLKRDPNLEKVLAQTVNFIKNYSGQSGFRHTLMGKHDYNPARNIAGENANFESTKIHHWEEDFYSDILWQGKAIGLGVI